MQDKDFLKFIAGGLWIFGAYANYIFFVAFGVGAGVSLALSLFSQATFTYLEHVGIRKFKGRKTVSGFAIVIAIAAMLDIVMTATGIYAKLVSLPQHTLGYMLEAINLPVHNASLVIAALVLGTFIAIATEVIWNES